MAPRSVAFERTAQGVLALDNQLEFLLRIVGWARGVSEEGRLDEMTDALCVVEQQRLHTIQHLLHRFCTGSAFLDRALYGVVGAETPAIPAPIHAAASEFLLATGARPEKYRDIVRRAGTAVLIWSSMPPARSEKAAVYAVSRLTARLSKITTWIGPVGDADAEFLAHCQCFVEAIARLGETLRRAVLVSALVDQQAVCAQILEVGPERWTKVLCDGHATLRAAMRDGDIRPASPARPALEEDFRWLAERLIDHYAA